MKILVAIDGSEPSLHAARHAIALATNLRTPPAIALISVHDDTALRHATHFVGKQAVVDHLHAQSATELAPAAAAFRDAGIEVETIVRIGHVAHEIAAAADTGGFDLVVMGSKGRSGLTDLLIGSVAHRVSAMSKVPVLLVK